MTFVSKRKSSRNRVVVEESAVDIYGRVESK